MCKDRTSNNAWWCDISPSTSSRDITRTTWQLVLLLICYQLLQTHHLWQAAMFCRHTYKYTTLSYGFISLQPHHFHYNPIVDIFRMLWQHTLSNTPAPPQHASLNTPHTQCGPSTTWFFEHTTHSLWPLYNMHLWTQHTPSTTCIFEHTTHSVCVLILPSTHIHPWTHHTLSVFTNTPLHT